MYYLYEYTYEIMIADFRNWHTIPSETVPHDSHTKFSMSILAVSHSRYCFLNSILTYLGKHRRLYLVLKVLIPTTMSWLLHLLISIGSQTHFYRNASKDFSVLKMIERVAIGAVLYHTNSPHLPQNYIPTRGLYCTASAT